MARREREDKNYLEFEKWAQSLIAAQPGNLSRKGADKGLKRSARERKPERQGRLEL